jgi:dihydroflavonol-4-reductase
MNKTICITGATGFLASHLICKLLPYNTLHVTTRNKSYFISNCLPKLSKIVDTSSLKIFECDYTSEETILEALHGCDSLIHCASPVILTSYPDDERNQTYIINPALQITENVLRCVNKTSINLVLYTSSTSAIYSASKKFMTKNDWADESSSDPYTLSKVLSEKRAWELSATAKWKLVVLLPARIIGPTIYSSLPESYISIFEILNTTKSELLNYHSSFCDVRDVCNIYALFLEKTPKSGRYIISFDIVPLVAYYNAVRQIKPIHPVHFIDTNDSFTYDNSEIIEVYTQTPIDFVHSIQDSLASMK